MTLDFTPLEKAIGTWKEALDEYEKTHNIFVRDACIQRFGYTYDLSHKMLKRYLEEISANPSEVSEMSFQDLIRKGAEVGALDNSWDVWKGYRHARNVTSHAYDEAKAEQVFEQISEFYAEAKFLLNNLKQQNI
ncbi:MAG: nucleotidyltransferase substrate binding protein [Alphaproteobacteria bacterium]|nr:nucleotidyltransferase substrate binding protein [Alphaproteobacteria bacterium]